MPTFSVARKRGRPLAYQAKARGQILDALIQLLESAPLARPNLSSVARAAGVTPALLHYHFGDLAGLLGQLQEERGQPLLQPMLQDLREPGPNAGAALVRFLQKWTVLALRHPWLIACLLQAPAQSGGTAQGGAGLIRAVVAAAQRQGTVRRDLPDTYLTVLLLTLGTMPHLAQTALASGIDAKALRDPDHAATLTLQHLAVLQAGVARSQGS